MLPMRYREIAPPKDLQNLILSFWEFAVAHDAPSPIAQEIFPDGCVSLFYLRNIAHGIHVAGLSGLYMESVTKSLSPGDTIWGVRFSPAAASTILRADASEMIGTSTFDPNLFPHLLAGIASSLQPIETFENAIPILERRLREGSREDEKPDETVAAAVGIIEQELAETRVGDLAKTLNLSTRQLQRRFKTSSGLTPKQYIRARRIRAAAVHVVECDGYNMADRAAELGFADQAHMSHELSAVTKRSPNSFAQNVTRIEHGNLVK